MTAVAPIAAVALTATALIGAGALATRVGKTLVKAEAAPVAVTTVGPPTSIFEASAQQQSAGSL